MGGEWEDEREIDVNEDLVTPAKLAEVRPVAERRVESPAKASKSVEGKNVMMAKMGRSGGQARAVSLTAERRREIARLGGLARAAGKRKEG